MIDLRVEIDLVLLDRLASKLGSLCVKLTIENADSIRIFGVISLLRRLLKLLVLLVHVHLLKQHLFMVVSDSILVLLGSHCSLIQHLEIGLLLLRTFKFGL